MRLQIQVFVRQHTDLHLFFFRYTVSSMYTLLFLHLMRAEYYYLLLVSHPTFPIYVKLCPNILLNVLCERHLYSLQFSCFLFINCIHHFFLFLGSPALCA
jgi:hypothetical protein